jgi:hypothetical protein
MPTNNCGFNYVDDAVLRALKKDLEYLVQENRIVQYIKVSHPEYYNDEVALYGFIG